MQANVKMETSGANVFHPVRERGCEAATEIYPGAPDLRLAFNTGVRWVLDCLRWSTNNDELPRPAPGTIWQRPSGKQYQVMSVSSISDDPEKNHRFPVIVYYRSLEDNRQWWRFLSDWVENMRPSHSKPCSTPFAFQAQRNHEGE